MNNQSGILIVVHDNNMWDAYGTPFSDRDKMLMATLNQIGGINESVTPGNYMFNVKHLAGEVIAELVAV